MESQIYNHEYNNRIAEYKMEIKKKKMQQNDEQVKITLTQWTPLIEVVIKKINLNCIDH